MKTFARMLPVIAIVSGMGTHVVAKETAVGLMTAGLFGEGAKFYTKDVRLSRSLVAVLNSGIAAAMIWHGGLSGRVPGLKKLRSGGTTAQCIATSIVLMSSLQDVFAAGGFKSAAETKFLPTLVILVWMVVDKLTAGRFVSKESAIATASLLVSFLNTALLGKREKEDELIKEEDEIDSSGDGGDNPGLLSDGHGKGVQKKKNLQNTTGVGGDGDEEVQEEKNIENTDDPSSSEEEIDPNPKDPKPEDNEKNPI